MAVAKVIPDSMLINMEYSDSAEKVVDLSLTDQREIVEVVLKPGQVWADPRPSRTNFFMPRIQTEFSCLLVGRGISSTTVKGK